MPLRLEHEIRDQDLRAHRDDVEVREGVAVHVAVNLDIALDG